MNVGGERSRKAAKDALQALDFDIRRYDGCADLDAAGWLSLLSIRNVRADSHNKIGASPNATREKWTQLFRHDLKDPLLLGVGLRFRKSIPETRSVTWGSIQDATLMDLWRARWLLKKVPGAITQCIGYERARLNREQAFREALLARRERAPTDQDMEKIMQLTRPVPLPRTSFHGMAMESEEALWNVERRGNSAHFYHLTLNNPYVAVNLNAADDRILTDFKQWLSQKREKLSQLEKNQGRLRRAKLPESDKRKKPPSGRFTAYELNNWSRYKALAWIDLKLFSQAIGIKPTRETLADHLFPHEHGGIERIRKYSEPLGRWLMTHATQDALASHVAQTAASSLQRAQKA